MTDRQTSVTKVSLLPDTNDSSLIWCPDLGHPADGEWPDLGPYNRPLTTKIGDGSVVAGGKPLYTISEDYLNISGPGSTGLTTDTTAMSHRVPPFTISAWFRGTTTGQNGWLTAYGLYEYYIAISSTGALRGGALNHLVITTPGADPRDGNWHHLVCTITSTGYTVLYLDGVEVGTRDDGYDTGTFSTYYSVGLYGVSSWIGDIGGVAWYSEAKSADWVRDQWNRVAGGVVYFRGDRDSWPTTPEVYNSAGYVVPMYLRNGLYLEEADRVQAGQYDLIGTGDSTQIYWYNITSLIWLFNRSSDGIGGRNTVWLPFGEIEFTFKMTVAAGIIFFAVAGPDPWEVRADYDDEYLRISAGGGIVMQTANNYFDRTRYNRLRFVAQHLVDTTEEVKYTLYLNDELVVADTGTNPVTVTGTPATTNSFLYLTAKVGTYVVLADDSHKHDLLYRPLWRVMP